MDAASSVRADIDAAQRVVDGRGQPDAKSVVRCIAVAKRIVAGRFQSYAHVIIRGTVAA